MAGDTNPSDPAGSEASYAAVAGSAGAAALGRVLVVEDDPDVRELMTVILSEAGYSVATAGDGEEALRVASESAPDLVVLDLILPGATGWEIAARFSARAGRRVPVIAATASPSGLFRLPPDVVCVLHKPFDPDALVAAVHAAISADRAGNDRSSQAA